MAKTRQEKDIEARKLRKQRGGDIVAQRQVVSSLPRGSQERAVAGSDLARMRSEAGAAGREIARTEAEVRGRPGPVEAAARSQKLKALAVPAAGFTAADRRAQGLESAGLGATEAGDRERDLRAAELARFRGLADAPVLGPRTEKREIRPGAGPDVRDMAFGPMSDVYKKTLEAGYNVEDRLVGPPPAAAIPAIAAGKQQFRQENPEQFQNFDLAKAARDERLRGFRSDQVAAVDRAEIERALIPGQRADELDLLRHQASASGLNAEATQYDQAARMAKAQADFAAAEVEELFKNGEKTRETADAEIARIYAEAGLLGAQARSANAQAGFDEANAASVRRGQELEDQSRARASSLQSAASDIGMTADELLNMESEILGSFRARSGLSRLAQPGLISGSSSSVLDSKIGLLEQMPRATAAMIAKRIIAGVVAQEGEPDFMYGFQAANDRARWERLKALAQLIPADDPGVQSRMRSLRENELVRSRGGDANVFVAP